MMLEEIYYKLYNNFIQILDNIINILIHFHCEYYYWLIGLIAIPIVCILYRQYFDASHSQKNLERFIDKELLPHILLNNNTKLISAWKSIILGSIIWTCLMIAMAGPRWNFKEFDTYKDDGSLVILLDLSISMNANDVLPSRIIRAKQEIEDILNFNENTKIGLIGFAADAHMISALTDDIANINYILPFVDTDLIAVQGTRILPALRMAKDMLISEPGHNKAMLVISDGDFNDQSDSDVEQLLNEMSNNITIHTLGVATKEGANISYNNQSTISYLHKDHLKKLSDLSDGIYLDTNYSNKNAQKILSLLESSNDNIYKQHRTIKYWEERFYIFLIPVILIILCWFRSGFMFPIFALSVIICSNSAFADTNTRINGYNPIDTIMLNKAQLGQKALYNNDIEAAIANFQDPYRLGITHYKAGLFQKAEQEFRKTQREIVKEDALYNLGNALAAQLKLQDAIDVYKKLLNNNPLHKDAKYNLEIVKKMLQKQKDSTKDKKKDNQSDSLENSSNSDQNHSPDIDQTSKNKNDRSSSDKNQESNNDMSESNKYENGRSSSDSSSNTNQENNNSKTVNNDQNINNTQLDQKQNVSDSELSEEDKFKNHSNNDKSNTRKHTEYQHDKSNNSFSDQDLKIDQLLNLISNDYKDFLKKQFYIESYKQQTKQTNDLW